MEQYKKDCKNKPKNLATKIKENKICTSWLGGENGYHLTFKLTNMDIKVSIHYAIYHIMTND